MDYYLYGLMFRNCRNWKTNPNYVVVNDRQLDGIADKINCHLAAVYPTHPCRGLLEGLAYFCAFLIIPYGQEGRQYAEEKISPATLEDFLWEKGQELLNTVEIFDEEKNRELYDLARDYCQNYSRQSIPFGPVATALLATRFQSENLKDPQRLISRRNTREQNEKVKGYINHASSCFRSFNTSPPETLDLHYHLEQLLQGNPEPTDFVFTDTHRREIDNLPMFTGFGKPPRAPSP